MYKRKCLDTPWEHCYKCAMDLTTEGTESKFNVKTNSVNSLVSIIQREFPLKRIPYERGITV